MKSFVVLALMAAYLSIIAGCGTMAGVGQDIQSAGEKVEDAASRKK
ncbi:MAG: entericidin A/B family lipoprotein [Thiotrichales bacterium]